MPQSFSQLTPDYSWDAAAGQYRNITSGQFVPRSVIVDALKAYRTAKIVEIEALGAQLQNGQISLAAFQLAMEQNIANVHLVNGAAAKGGWAQMSQADYGRVGQRCQVNYQFLAEFCNQIQNGQIPLDGHFLNRVRLYGLAGYNTFWRQTTADMVVKGADEARRRRHKTDSCNGCITEEARGWVPIATAVMPGDNECLGNCGCTQDFRVSATGQVL